MKTNNNRPVAPPTQPPTGALSQTLDNVGCSLDTLESLVSGITAKLGSGSGAGNSAPSVQPSGLLSQASGFERRAADLVDQLVTIHSAL